AARLTRVPHEPPPRVDGDGDGLVLTRGDEVRSRRTCMLARYLLVGPRSRGEVLLHRHAAADPSVGLVRRVQHLVLPAPLLRERPAAGDDAPVDGGHHVADHTRAWRARFLVHY